jgi:Predicted membrane protein (DUF2207)
MMQRVLLVLTTLMLFLSQPSAPAKTYSAEQFNQAITVQQDGSLLVKETVVFTFTGGPFTYVYRDLPTDKTDGVVVLSATMDERAMPRGTGAGQVEIATGNPVKVTWHFAPLADQTHTFVLTYRDLGVVQKASGADLLNWEVLPTQYDYAIRSSTTVVSYPEQTALLGAPQVTRGAAQMIASPGTVTFLAHDIGAGSPLEIALRFRAGSLVQAAPHWQQLQEQAQALIVPYLLGGLALFLALFLLAIWHYRYYRRRSLPVEEQTSVCTQPPDELPSALVGAVFSPSEMMSWNSALATIFDLASRDVLAISRVPGPKKWYRMRPDFLIEQRCLPEELRPHELGLLSVLFQGKEGMRTSITISNLSRKYTNRYRRFTRPLRQEMIERGLLDANLRRMRAWLVGISMSLAIVAFIAAVVAGSIAGPSGMWPVAFLPLGVALAGCVACVLWLTFSPLTPQGQQEAAQWKSFSRYLKNIMHGREPVAGPETFGAYLVYAASCGFVEQWVKYFQRQGTVDAPPWFHSLATARADDMAYFVTMIAASHAAGSASGAGGGGAAGGGASGAG